MPPEPDNTTHDNTDFYDEDVSDLTPAALGSRIKLRIRRYPSVQVFMDGSRVVLRTWVADLVVENAIGNELEEE